MHPDEPKWMLVYFTCILMVFTFQIVWLNEKEGIIKNASGRRDSSTGLVEARISWSEQLKKGRDN